MFVETMVRSHWKDGCPAVERCYGLSARSRNESISACWPVRQAARGHTLEIQMPAGLFRARWQQSALLHSSCRCWPVLSDIESRWSGPRWWLMPRHHNSDYMIIARMMKIILMIFAMEMLSWWLSWKAFVSDVRSCQNHANHTHFNTSILLRLTQKVHFWLQYM